MSIAEQAEKVAAARAAADREGVPIFVNARCDVYFGAQLPEERRQAEVVERAAAYASAGADGLFLPGLMDIETIRAISAAVSLPLNVMVLPGLPGLPQLSDAGVKRVSQGATLFLATIGGIVTTTHRFLHGELVPPTEEFQAGFAMVPQLVR